MKTFFEGTLERKRKDSSEAEDFLRAAFVRAKEVPDADLGMSDGEIGAMILQWTNEIENEDEGEIFEKRKELFLAAMRLSGEFPASADGVINIIGQDPVIFSAREWVDVMADTIWRPEVAEGAKERLMRVFAYAYAFGGNMDEALSAELDFDHPREYFRVGAFLEFLGRFFNATVRTSFLESRGKDESLKRVFDSVISENKGSYFLNARARVLREQMEDGESPVGLDGDRGVFVLAPGIEGRFEKGVLLERRRENEITESDTAALLDPFAPSVRGRTSPSRAGGEKFHPVSYTGFVGTEEERQKMLFEYTALAMRPMRELIGRDLGVNITEFSKEEQIFFLQFIKNIEAKDVERVRGFFQTFEYDGLRAFLSLEHGGEKMGGVILAIAEQYGETDARKIFAKYGEIVVAARGAKEYLLEQLGEARYEEAHSVSNGLLQRGKNFLLNIGSVADGKECVRLMEEIRAEVLLLRAVIVEEGIAGNLEAMEKMRDMQRREMSGAELLSDVDLWGRVCRIYRGHYEGKGFPEGFSDAIVGRFEGRLREPGSRFFALLYKNEPQAFLLASKNGEDCELSALNTNPEFEFTRAGLALVRGVMKQYLSAGVSIVGDCPENMVSTYTRRFGFSVVGGTEFGGQKLILLRKDPDKKRE